MRLLDINWNRSSIQLLIYTTLFFICVGVLCVMVSKMIVKTPYSVDLATYLHSVHPNMYKAKIGTKHTPNMEEHHFIQIYSQSIQDIQQQEQKELLHHIRDTVRKCFQTHKIQSIFTTLEHVDFKCSSSQIEGNMPYTIGQTIILPSHMVERMQHEYSTKNSISKRDIETIIHEYFHILQRNNQGIMDQFYIHHYPFLERKVDLVYIPEFIKENYMTNPDSNHSIWVYLYENKPYIVFLGDGSLINSNKTFCSVGYNAEDEEYIHFNSLDNIGNGDWMYHPNEIFATVVSSLVIHSEYDEEQPELMFLRNTTFT
jgi:hypothetical protein